MLSGRGIDGELKSKFGELTEKFWQSGAKNGDLRAIYLTSEGGSNGGCETLRNLGSSDKNTKLITTENGSADKVKSLFSVCVGNQNGNGCKENKNNASVVLVGDDPNVNASMTWEKLKEQNWGQTSLVRSEHSYEGLFKKFERKGKRRIGGNSFEPSTLVRLITNTGWDKSKLIEPLCPLVSFVPRRRKGKLNNSLGVWCKKWWNRASEEENRNLSYFFRNERSKEYFNNKVWGHYGKGWEALALLVLLDLWSSKLTDVNFDRSLDAFNQSNEGFRLSSLMTRSGTMLSLSGDGPENNLTSISYHSGDKWTLRLCSGGGACNDTDGLDVIVGNDQICVSTVVCVNGSDIKTHYQELKSHWENFKGGQSAGGLWNIVFGSEWGTDHLERLLIALLVACFKDVKNVSLTVQKPSKEGKVIFKLMEEKK